MKLVVGLGNPGREYARHRHNIGFMVVEALCQQSRIPLSAKFDGLSGQGTLGGEKVLYLLPQTFMNLSGDSVAAAARFFKVEPADALVIHDELDLPYGRLQLKVGGGAGGHNGLKSIIERWGIQDFARLRFGVGKPEGPNAKERVSSHVLSGFGSEEQPSLPGYLEQACEMVASWASEGMAVAMNRYNRR